jgi:hypothetical protein
MADSDIIVRLHLVIPFISMVTCMAVASLMYVCAASCLFKKAVTSFVCKY